MYDIRTNASAFLRGSYTGGRREEAVPSALFHGGQEVPYITNSFSDGHYICRSYNIIFRKDNFKFMSISISPVLWRGILRCCGQTPQISSIAYYCYENNISSIFFPEEKFNTKIYPCGGTYMYIDMPSVEAFPPALVTHRRPWSFSKLLPPPTLMVLRSFWWQWW